MTFSDQQIKMFAKDLQKSIGRDGWRFMTQEVREAMVGNRALLIIMGLERETVPVKDIQKLVIAMMAAVDEALQQD